MEKLNSNKKLNNYFELVSRPINSIKEKVICYDLTHSLGNFLHGGEILTEINSTKKEIFANDFIISRLRSYLKEFAVVQPENLRQLVSSEYLIYRAKTDEISTNTLMIFCLTHEVQTILNLSQYGSEHPRFYDFVFNEMPLPKCLFDLNLKIEKMVKEAHEKMSQSKRLYSEAENLLLRELDLENFTPKNEAVSIKRLSDTFSSGRLDAEFYQSKYDKLFEILSKHNCVKLGEIVDMKKSIEPGSEFYTDSGIPFVRVSDVSKFGISQTQIFLSPQNFDLENLRPKKDTILLSKDGSIGIAYKISKDENFITSGALLHLLVKNKNVLPDFLTLLLNSIVVQMQAERDANGAIIAHWKPSDISNVIIPLLPLQSQEKIAEKLQKSFELKNEAKNLLEKAKISVENEIEK